MNRLTAGVTNSLPAALKMQTGNLNLAQKLMLGQTAFYITYELMSGPARMKLQRYLTVTPESTGTSLATFHMFHTSAMPLALNMGVMYTLG